MYRRQYSVIGPGVDGKRPRYIDLTVAWETGGQIAPQKCHRLTHFTSAYVIIYEHNNTKGADPAQYIIPYIVVWRWWGCWLLQYHHFCNDW